MLSQIHAHEAQLIQDVWGKSCIECDCLAKPKVHFYSLKDEQVGILTCPACDFTIVVVEVEKLQSNCYQEELLEKRDALIATHSFFKS